jgi:hypothetical protein
MAFTCALEADFSATNRGFPDTYDGMADAVSSARGDRFHGPLVNLNAGVLC